MQIWSSTDFPYQCLLDFKRTTMFQAAIQAIVKQGDIVLDAGAGSGILSLTEGQLTKARVNYQMGGGLGSFRAGLLQE